MHKITDVFRRIYEIILRYSVALYLIFIRKRIKIKINFNSLKTYWNAATLSVWSALKSKKPLLPRPAALIGLSLECNLKCAFCLAYSPLIADEEEKKANLTWMVGKNISRDDIHLKLDKFKDIIDDLEYLRPIRIDFSGNGEPLLYPFLPDALAYIKSRKRLKKTIVELTTNGVLLDEKLSKKLLDLKIDIIDFSINASNPNTYKIMHFVDEAVFYKVTDNIKKFIKLADTYIDKTRIHAKFVLCKKNYRELIEMIKLCDSLGIEKIGFRIMLFCSAKANRVKDYILEPAEKEELKNLVFQALLEVKKRKIFVNLSSLLRALMTKKKGSFLTSIKDVYRIQIQPNGIVNPTYSLYYMGNVYDESILSIWYSNKYFAYRNIMKKRILFKKFTPCREFCRRCSLPERQTERCNLIS